MPTFIELTQVITSGVSRAVNVAIEHIEQVEEVKGGTHIHFVSNRAITVRETYCEVLRMIGVGPPT